jgi:hypothetical protein
MKKLTYAKNILYTGTLFVIVNCSNEPTQPVIPKVYSTTTQKEFEEIEKTDLRTSPPHRSTLAPTPPRAPVVLKENPRAKLADTQLINDLPKSEISDTSQLSTKNKERLQEINQNLAFYCMKHRKDSRFRDEENCLAFTKKVLVTCEKKHKLINTIMVNCIKDHLKKNKL